MSYALENALFQWEEGEQRLREVDGPGRSALERAAGLVLDELRRRLGSRFSLQELTDVYAGAGEWASEAARTVFAGTESAWLVDAAFARYAREAVDYRGGAGPEPRFAAGD